METKDAFQDQWRQECRLAQRAINYALRGQRQWQVEAIADVMIDRGLRALSEAPTAQIQRHAVIGTLRFVEFRLSRYEEVKKEIPSALRIDRRGAVCVRMDKIKTMMGG
jgi:hypothetical protein